MIKYKTKLQYRIYSDTFIMFDTLYSVVHDTSDSSKQMHRTMLDVRVELEKISVYDVLNIESFNQ